MQEIPYFCAFGRCYQSTCVPQILVILPLFCPSFYNKKRPQERDAPGVLFMNQIPSSFFQVFGPQIPSTVTPAAF